MKSFTILDALNRIADILEKRKCDEDKQKIIINKKLRIRGAKIGRK